MLRDDNGHVSRPNRLLKKGHAGVGLSLSLDDHGLGVGVVLAFDVLLRRG